MFHECKSSLQSSSFEGCSPSLALSTIFDESNEFFPPNFSLMNALKTANQIKFNDFNSFCWKRSLSMNDHEAYQSMIHWEPNLGCFMALSNSTILQKSLDTIGPRVNYIVEAVTREGSCGLFSPNLTKSKAYTKNIKLL